jgi:hypothetical protein
MDPAYLSAFAALAGSTIGGLTSLATSWFTQHAQFRAQQLGQDLVRREDLYKHFIEEASRLYTDAFEHNQPDVSKMVNLYALISRMRVLSTPQVVESADRVARTIIETYLGPNRTFGDLLQLMEDDAINPLKEFSTACRDDLQGRRFV